MDVVKQLGIVAPIPKGDWNNATTYQQLNIVRHNNASYIARMPSLGIEPNNNEKWMNYWQVISFGVDELAQLQIDENTTRIANNEAAFLDINHRFNEQAKEVKATHEIVSDNANRLKAISSILSQNDLVAVKTITQQYAVRQTADGEAIMDGACEVKKISGNTIASGNLINVNDIVVGSEESKEWTFDLLGRFMVEKNTDYFISADFQQGLNGAALSTGVSISVRKGSSMETTIQPNMPTTLKRGGESGSLYGAFNTGDESSIYIYAYSNDTSQPLATSCRFYNIMLTKGTEQKAYTPFFSGFKSTSIEKIRSCGRNLLRYPYTSSVYNKNGVTFTANMDGSITIRGTAEGATEVEIGSNYAIVPQKAYQLRLIGKPSNISMQLRYFNQSGFDTPFLVSGLVGAVVAPNIDRNYRAVVIVADGASVNTTIYPMLYEGEETIEEFIPYVEDEYELNLNNLLSENYVDIENQRVIEFSRVLDIKNECAPFNAFSSDGVNQHIYTEGGRERILFIANIYKSSNYGKAALLSSVHHVSTSLMSDTSVNAGVYIANKDGDGVYLWFDKATYPDFYSETADRASVNEKVNKFVRENNFQILYLLREQRSTKISVPETYRAYNKGAEAVIQSEAYGHLGVPPTITQEYYGKVGALDE